MVMYHMVCTSGFLLGGGGGGERAQTFLKYSHMGFHVTPKISRICSSPPLVTFSEINPDGIYCYGLSLKTRILSM